MAGALRKIDPLFQLRQELLKACDNILFEVHQGPPPFWNGELDQKLEAYLAPQPRCSFSTCPICGHKLEATQAPPDFHDPWWLYPQKSFQDAKTCSHFELLTFSILWSHAEPMAPPWLIPCGWGVPALSESLSHDENLAVSIKTTSLGNGAIIFWMGLFRKQPGIPLASDFWSLPTLKTRAPIHPTLNSRGFWGEFSPISTQTPFIWSQIHFEQSDGRLINYEDQKSLENLAPKLRHWSLMTYNQPLKMYKDRFVSESGFASFAIGMRSTRTKGALFISQTPIVAGHFQAPPRPLKIAQPKHSHPHFQGLSIQQMQDLAQTDTLWALIDPFQNETTQDWLRLIRRDERHQVISVWTDSELEEGWRLTADSSQAQSIDHSHLLEFYRDLSPQLVQVTSDIFEISLRYGLGAQSWGAFFISSANSQELHHFIRQRLMCHFQNYWVYFRFYEPNFLSSALLSLQDEDLNFFYGPIDGWIIRHPSEAKHSLYSRTELTPQSPLERVSPLLPTKVHEIAQRVFHDELPRRIKEFIVDRTPEFASLIPPSVIDRWVRDSVRQANFWGIRKEVNLIKFFLWKVLITPTWCHLPPFIRLLQQSVNEEIKVQNIENLFPQLRAAEIPRDLTIESWDAELWSELRKFQSPIGHTDPEAFHPLLGERPPAMPLHNPKWLKALGLLYESAYADLFNHSGVHLLNSAFSKEVNRPLHAPPRLLSLSVNEIIVRDDGTRTQSWLKEHGFEGIASMAGHWMHRSSNPQTILLITRQFLEEFPYVENRLMFDSLSDVDRRAITEGIELYWVLWDSHGFWNLNKI